MNVSRDTWNRLEKGDASIAIGTSLRALRILGMEKDFETVAQNDELGRKLQDAKLLVRTTRGRAHQSLPIGPHAAKGNAIDEQN